MHSHTTRLQPTSQSKCTSDTTIDGQLVTLAPMAPKPNGKKRQV